MNGRFTFTQKITVGFGAVVLIAIAVAGVATYALRDVVRRQERALDVGAIHLVNAERLHAMSAQKGNQARAYLMTRSPAYVEALRATRAEIGRIVATLRREVDTDDERRLVDEIEAVELAHERALQAIFAVAPTTPLDVLAARTEREMKPLRERLDGVVDRFIEREQQLLGQEQRASSEAATNAVRLVLGLAALAVLLAIALSVVLARTLARQVSSAVRHVETSSAELQATAGQQATGAKEQATAMTEITTTITELLATSRQISESAQRVAGIASETAAAARAGDHTVLRSQESVGAIRRQVDLIVNHMLELGRKSQQIGGILEIINELAEQTNILAINATIEAAGAGDAGKRFAVVAEEIRKLADRVGGSTKDIRVLIDEVRSAVNTTVMATESGSKAVEAGARQFGDVAAAFTHIARLVATTTDAAREIELSTKQQSTAVEQVNVAIANVAQATREAEASSGQALQTASQLAAMSRDLSQLVQTRAAA